jgi:hypothetical protein
MQRALPVCNLSSSLPDGRLELPSLAHCPEFLPSDLTSLVESFGRAWAASPSRPRPEAHVMEHWSKLLAEWAGLEDLPLFVRKPANNRGSVIVHDSGRSIVPCDNSPAHWAYVLASQSECPLINDIRAFLTEDSIPIAMILKSIEKPAARYRCTLTKKFNVNQFGWKLAHIAGVGLNSRASISTLPIERLTAQFIALMNPANMFVVPIAWAGIAELEAVIQAVASAR